MTVYWKIFSINEITKLTFTHSGLTPEFKCYNICTPTWDMFIPESLKMFVESGKGNPQLS